jgi:hypothetical protein
VKIIDTILKLFKLFHKEGNSATKRSWVFCKRKETSSRENPCLPGVRALLWQQARREGGI